MVKGLEGKRCSTHLFDQMEKRTLRSDLVWGCSSSQGAAPISALCDRDKTQGTAAAVLGEVLMDVR